MKHIDDQNEDMMLIVMGDHGMTRTGMLLLSRFDSFIIFNLGTQFIVCFILNIILTIFFISIIQKKKKFHHRTLFTQAYIQYEDEEYSLLVF